MIDILGIKYITDKEASARYGFSLSWFQKQRGKKESPPYVKLLNRGKVYYSLDELDQWFKENMFHSKDL